MVKRKIRRVTFETKLEVINLISNGMQPKEVQEILNLKPYQVRDILRYKEKLLNAHLSGNLTDTTMKTIRDDLYADLNIKICEWMQSFKEDTGSMPSNNLIKAKALEIAKKDQIKTFKASYCWIYKMKDRVNKAMAKDNSNECSPEIPIDDFLEIALEEQGQIPTSVLDDLVEVYAKIKEASIQYKIDPISLVKQLDSYMSKHSSRLGSQYFKGSLKEAIQVYM